MEGGREEGVRGGGRRGLPERNERMEGGGGEEEMERKKWGGKMKEGMERRREGEGEEGNELLGACDYPPYHHVQYAKVTKLTSDAKFEDSDIKASIAALSFILSSAAKHSVDGDSLDNELQQLGLPKGKERGHLACKRLSVCYCTWHALLARSAYGVNGAN